MSTELSKSYEPAAVEQTAYQTWMQEKCFAADPSAPGEAYSIVIPPPNVTGALHLGHAINNTLQDILTRRARMQGKNALWVPGIDHAGIATQAVVEKQLKEKENKTRHDVGREGFVSRIWEWKQQYGDRILMQLQRLGCSCDWDRTRFTLDEMCARAVRETFFKLFKDGLIYRGKRLVNWDIHLQTSISDDEIYHENVKTFLWHVQYPIVDDGSATRGAGVSPTFEDRGRDARATEEARATHMTVATTRPETMLGDTAVAVHSEDPRWNWAIGKFVELPLTGRKIPIIADDILVDPEFGSGVVKVTPAHDPNDYAVWQRHQGESDQIDIINILNNDGTINANGGKYAGMKRDKARAAVVEDLKALGLLVKEEPYETQVGHSDRSKTPVEPYLSDQWFVKMAPLAEPALEVVRNGTIKFYPERHAQQYLSWLGEKRDWPISRQLWWGHRIPVWSREMTGADCEELFEESHEFAALLQQDEETNIAAWVTTANETYSIVGHHKHFECLGQALGEERPVKWMIVPQSDSIQIDGMPIASWLEQHGFVQDPDVLDTWFSSALWPHSTLGWPEENPWLEKYYPTSVLMTGRDIITLWVARMVMTGMYNMGKASPSPSGGGQGRGDASTASDLKSADALSLTLPRGGRGQEAARALGIPFYDVAINPTILDGKGERMSKSKGNGVDPVDIIETHGADALRFTLATMATETQDVRLPVKKLPDGRNTSDKFDLGRNFCTKLWNACRFALSNIAAAGGVTSVTPSDEKLWSLADRWIVSRFNRTVAEADSALAQYRFDTYSKLCYDFFWRDFCDWYVEAIKPAMKDPARAAQTAAILAAVLDGSLRLLHPIIPFITETIWWKLNEVRPVRGLPGHLETRPSKRLIHASWPSVGAFCESAEAVFPRLQEIIGAIRNLRNDYKVDPKKPVVVSISAAGDVPQSILQNRELMETLGICTLKDVRSDLPQPGNSARALAAGCEVFVEGLVDENAEKERDAKMIEDLTRKISAMQGRLNNAGYIAKAPAKLVEETRKELAEAEAELKRLREK